MHFLVCFQVVDVTTVDMSGNFAIKFQVGGDRPYDFWTPASLPAFVFGATLRAGITVRDALR